MRRSSEQAKWKRQMVIEYFIASLLIGAAATAVAFLVGAVFGAF